MKLHIVAAATLALGTTAAFAQDRGEDTATAHATQATQQEEDAAEEEDDRGSEVVCRTERVTGSLTRRTRTCLTRDEWDLMESRTKDALDRMGRNAAGSPQLCNDPTRPSC